MTWAETILDEMRSLALQGGGHVFTQSWRYVHAGRGTSRNVQHLMLQWNGWQRTGSCKSPLNQQEDEGNVQLTNHSR